MFFYEQVNKYQALDDWFRTPQGIRVSEAFTDELRSAQSFLSGRRLLQLGNCGKNDWLTSLKFNQKWIVTPSIAAKTVTLYSLINNLAIDRNSVDCVLAPLTLEAFADDKDPLDEIDRVLKPMGYAVFFGINPWSFWGAALNYGRLSCFAHTSASLSSSLALKHAMLQRGYRQCILNSFYYIPPIMNRKLIYKLEFLNQMGKMIWPYPAGFYCFIAQKHQTCPPYAEYKPSILFT